jgi:hypothetical protein
MSAFCEMASDWQTGALETAFDEVTVEDFAVLLLLLEWLRTYAACAVLETELRRTGCLDSGLL